jgi:hypothetical protein
MRSLLAPGIGLALLTVQAHAQWAPGKRDTGINGHWGNPVRAAPQGSGFPLRDSKLKDDPAYRATLQRMAPKKPYDPWETMREAQAPK